MANYKTPGVYIEEISTFPPSVAQVETAIPALIGYTENHNDADPKPPTRISSMLEYQAIFGGPKNNIEPFDVNNEGVVTPPDISATLEYRLYYMLEMFFANGGGDCFIISVGDYNTGITNAAMLAGLDPLSKEDIPTLILFPDASTNPSDLYKAALSQCANRKDRFLICDVPESTPASVSDFRTVIGVNDLMYGAAYYPNLKTTLSYQFSEEDIKINHGSVKFLKYSDASIAAGKDLEESLFHAQEGKYKDAYQEIKEKIRSVKLELPPSASIAGVYARVDSSRGVWNAPANVSLNRVASPKIKIDDSEQEDLNVSASGKSINAIRSFKGKGVMVWGARTMDGNSNEWRYISVRRFFNMVEESVKSASERFVFEPNNANTWVKVKAMVENYLTTLWRAGALMGAKPEDAFFVNIGLGITMSAQDVLNGKMIIEIGMAAVRPAEFIILRFSHKMMES